MFYSMCVWTWITYHYIVYRIAYGLYVWLNEYLGYVQCFNVAKFRLKNQTNLNNKQLIIVSLFSSSDLCYIYIFFCSFSSSFVLHTIKLKIYAIIYLKEIKNRKECFECFGCLTFSGQKEWEFPDFIGMPMFICWFHRWRCYISFWCYSILLAFCPRPVAWMPYSIDSTAQLDNDYKR